MNCGPGCTSGFHPYELPCAEVARIGLKHADKQDLSERMIAIYADYKKAVQPQPTAPPAGPLKLDLGCGNSTRRAYSKLTRESGWTGVDLHGTEGADVHCDLARDKWPWPDSSVDEVNCAHMVEHIPRLARVHFFNELWRVLRPGAKAQVVTPHWASCRAYGDITHEWPPVSEMFWQYLDKNWREQNAPHVGFNCHFEVGYGYLTAAWLQAEVANRNPEFVQQRTNEALTKYKEAAQDMHATLKAVK